MRYYFKHRFERLRYFKNHADKAQNTIFEYNIGQLRRTRYGQDFGSQEISNYKNFIKKIPLVHYEDIESKILKVMQGDADVLWPGKSYWFAKSSGTSQSKSKYIPITSENLKKNHLISGWDTMTAYYHQRKNARVFADKSIIMGGSIRPYDGNKSVYVGDISAIKLHNMPSAGRPFYVPDFKTAVMEDWEQKINKIAEASIKQNITMIGGIPTWTQVLFNRILEKTKKQNLLEVWPDLKLYMHGGVHFAPYKALFSEYIPCDSFDYMNVYNASEGYFGFQDDLESEDLLLLTDHGIFYEFLSQNDWNDDSPTTLGLQDVEIDKPYALVITTNSGLWRYRLGDIIRFTSLSPYRYILEGRTNQSINMFGEELMVYNAEKALQQTCNQLNLKAVEYTVGPVTMKNDTAGRHHWLIEFVENPKDVRFFIKILDNNLMNLNSDYEAKRFRNLVLGLPQVSVVNPGTFERWFKKHDKFGGQNKIPRLFNTLKYVEELLDIDKKLSFNG